MPSSRSIVLAGALLALAAPAAVPGATPALAQEGVFMKDVLGTIGLLEKEQAPIHYRERAPLVLPPKMDLPPPSANASLRGAAWPQDPEATARERRREAARKPITRGEQGRMNDNNTTLGIDEMRAGRRAGAGLREDNAPGPNDENRQATWLTPWKLLEGKKDDEAQPSAVEPERVLLSEPPTGYRAPPGGRLERTNKDPVPTFTDRAEADPRAFHREQAGR